MQPIVTVTERKAAEAIRRTEAVATLLPVLAAYARAHGERFLLFGSAARRQMKFHSDVDLLLDFPDDRLTDAWNFTETACWDLGWNRICCRTGGASLLFWSTFGPT